jgi:hypothetical protein
MSKVIWRVGNLNFVFINFFYAILTAIFAIAILQSHLRKYSPT